MRYLIITWLFIKRFMKNPTFILILIIMPLLVTAFSKIEAGDKKNIKVGVYYEKDELSKIVCEKLKNKDSYIKFLIYDNKDEMIEAVESKKLECGYIFPSDFKDRLDNYKIKKIITCVEAPSTILSSLSDEIVFAEIIEEYGKNIAIKFAKDNSITGSEIKNTDEEVIKDYERYNTPEKTFSINYKYMESDGEMQTGGGDRTITYVIHGIISILILISGLFGAIKWFDDEKKGLYSSFNSKEKTIIGFIAILVPTIIMALSSALTIYLSGTYSNLLKENIAIILYALLVTGFSYVVKVIVKSGTDICALLPAITLGSLIFCPVFIDISKFLPFISWVNKFFPTFYYLNGIANGSSGFILMLIAAVVMILGGFVINLIKER